MANSVKNNPLRTRGDMELAAIQLIEPLLSQLSPGKARLRLGETGAAYDADIAEMEAFARPLWAIVPLLADGSQAVAHIWNIWSEGIMNGTDPAHPEYWGEIRSCGQRQVELAVFGAGMALAPEAFFFSLPVKAQKTLYAWLDQINRTELYHNNWLFFRVLVNIGFIACGLPHDARRLQSDFEALEQHYEGDGWYYDLPGQLDYYTPWAFHYYGLIYAKAMQRRDPERCARLLERGKRIAPDIACWFDAAGEALPYGRSLTYRFAQGAFFSALALAEGEGGALSYGQMKHLLLAHMRRWLSQPIFTRGGVLTIGYHYPNLLMAEGYNAPGSPYWALKAFACLALPASHPFWRAEEEPYHAPALCLQRHMRMLVARSGDGSHVIAYPAGNCCESHAHCEAKYEKFAYSTVFGFSVPKTQIHLAGGAFDSMLALSEDGVHWHTRYQAKEYSLSPRGAISRWQPMPGVQIETEIRPAGEWHVRIHRIRTQRTLHAAEGGFAIARGEGDEQFRVAENGCAAVFAPWGTSAVYALRGYDGAAVLQPEPNTNLMAPRTLLPTLKAELAPGEHVLACAVLGSAKRLETGVPAHVMELVSFDTIMLHDSKEVISDDDD